jgi:RNA methyltransferase, TrmH family
VPDPSHSKSDLLRSRQNAKVQEARRIARDPRLARREGVLLADGITLVQDAIEAGLTSRLILLDPESAGAASIRRAAARRHARVTPAAPAVVECVSTLATPQGAVGIFERPHTDAALLLAAPTAQRHPLVAVLHELQDPTNAGALTRAALAAGLSGIVTTAETVDPFHPRAIRGSMGACFRLPIAVDLTPAAVWETLRRGGYRLVALDPRGDVPLSAIRLDRPTAIILGREGSGLDRETRAACDGSVRIPMASEVESLGVAAAGAIAFYAISGLLDSK